MSPAADKKYNADMVGVAQTGRTMQAGGRGTGVEISTPSAVYNEDNAGMRKGHQGGDLNVSPVADKKYNADMGGVALTRRTMQAWGEWRRQEGQCWHGGEASGWRSQRSPVADKKDNAGMGEWAQTGGPCMQERGPTVWRHQCLQLLIGISMQA